MLGQGKFSIGPSIVALLQPGHWTLGILINNAWSVAGPSNRSGVNQMVLQYFVNYNMKKGWYITWQPIITANWKASSGNVWTVPYGGGVGRIMKLGFQPINLSAQSTETPNIPRAAPPGACALDFGFCSPSEPPEEKETLTKEKLKEMQDQKPRRSELLFWGCRSQSTA